MCVLYKYGGRGGGDCREMQSPRVNDSLILSRGITLGIVGQEKIYGAESCKALWMEIILSEWCGALWMEIILAEFDGCFSEAEGGREREKGVYSGISWKC